MSLREQAAAIAPSGRQHEITLREQVAVIVEVGARRLTSGEALISLEPGASGVGEWAIDPSPSERSDSNLPGRPPHLEQTINESGSEIPR